jgi:hypothetical protein
VRGESPRNPGFALRPDEAHDWDQGAIESPVGGDTDGFSRWLDAATERLRTQQWPTGPDNEQHAWEAPRVTPNNVERRARLTAIGNAIVPQVAYVFMLAIAMADADLSA